MEAAADAGGFVGDFDELVGCDVSVGCGVVALVLVGLKGKLVAGGCPASSLQCEGEPGEWRCGRVGVEVIDEEGECVVDGLFGVLGCGRVAVGDG